MAYSDFNLERVGKVFGLTISDNVNLFANVPELSSSNLLKETLDYNVPIALGSNRPLAKYFCAIMESLANFMI